MHYTSEHGDLGFAMRQDWECIWGSSYLEVWLYRCRTKQSGQLSRTLTASVIKVFHEYIRGTRYSLCCMATADSLPSQITSPGRSERMKSLVWTGHAGHSTRRGAW